jgi:hypothetical protein
LGQKTFLRWVLIISGNIEKEEKCQDVRNNGSDELIIFNLSGLKNGIIEGATGWKLTA